MSSTKKEKFPGATKLCSTWKEKFSSATIESPPLGCGVSMHQHDSGPKRTNYPRLDFMKQVGVISAFYRIFGQSFESLKQLMFWDNEKDIGNPTVDLSTPKTGHRIMSYEG